MVVRDAARPGVETEVGDFDHPTQVYWPGTGNDLIAVTEVSDGPRGPRWEAFRIDTRSKARAVIRQPDSHRITDCSRDGRRYLVEYVVNQPPGLGENQTSRLGIVNADGAGARWLVPVGVVCVRATFSPDGRRVLASLRWPASDNAELCVLDPDGPPATPVSPRLIGATNTTGSDWSPDGRRIAYIRTGMLPPDRTTDPPTRWCRYQLCVADADGGSVSVLLDYTEPYDVTDSYLRGVVWR